MATYVIGDIHGCVETLHALLEKINPSPKDTLWFCGDIVNRGPSSANCIRLIRSLKNRTVCVLGNHDLYLLAVASGSIEVPKDNGSIKDILDAKDNSELINWLRFLPLAYMEQKTILVHAGLLPNWEPSQTILFANEVSLKLRSDHWQDFMSELWGNTPNKWEENLQGPERFRTIVNGLTRIRFINIEGEMDFKNKHSPSCSEENLLPWFSHPRRLSKNHKVVFGHWSQLGLIIRPNLLSLDTGCVWGGMLTAARLEDNKFFCQQKLDH
jgi:bis(5'-nucleosyl)-tetraphosphatase (symmetrical)